MARFSFVTHYFALFSCACNTVSVVHDFVAVLLSETVGFCRGGDAQGHGHDNHMPEHNGHLFGEEVRIRALFQLICLI